MPGPLLQPALAVAARAGRRAGAALTTSAVVVLATVGVVAAFPAPAGADGDLSSVNSSRAGAGLAPLAEDAGLDQLALAHTQSMIARSTLFHTADLAAAFTEARPDWVRAGENVGVGPSVPSVDAAFMASPEHRANILGAYTLAGTAVVRGPDGRVWITQEFAAVGGSPAAAPPRRAAPAAAARVAPSPARTAAVPAASPVPGARGGGAVGAVGALAAPNGHGYELVGSDGGVFAFGAAPFVGSLGGRALNAPVTSGATTPDGRGYWLLGSDGGVFAFGTAGFYGSGAALHPDQPVVGMAATPDGRGYWLVGSDGGVFAFGDASFYGSAAGLRLNQPVVGAAATPDGFGYWLTGADGGVFAFGNAPYAGSRAG